MQQLNNLDVIILIVIGISALIALSRGLVKEVLSIIGWVLGTMAIIYMLPILTPIASLYIKTGWLAGVVTSLFVLISFLIIWILFTGKIVGKIRSSKLSNLDRMLGLFFGFVRAFLLVILFNILISWMIPKDKQADVLQQSKYFNIAGQFAQPIEALIPESTLKIIREKTQKVGEENEEELNKEDSKKKVEPKKEKKDDVQELFDKLAQPQIEKAKKEAKEQIKENFVGYKENERDNLDRLIENTLQ